MKILATKTAKKGNGQTKRYYNIGAALQCHCLYFLQGWEAATPSRWVASDGGGRTGRPSPTPKPRSLGPQQNLAKTLKNRPVLTAIIGFSFGQVKGPSAPRGPRGRSLRICRSIWQ